MATGNSLTRINNNQISDAISGNTQFGINANTKVQPYSVTSGLLANNINYQSDLTITGNLSVSGNTTSIDTTVVTIEDPMITLASTQTGAPTVDIGFIGERGTSNNVAFVWDESSKRFVTVYTNSAPGNVNINILSYADLQSSNVTIQGLLSANTVSLSGNVTSSLNVTGDITGGNIYSPATISAVGSMYAGNIYVPTGNLTATGVVSSNIYSGITSTQVVYADTNGMLVGNGNLEFSNNTLSTTGNIVAGINANAANVYISSLTNANAMIYAGTNGLVLSATNILTDGDGNLSATGNISASGVLATDLYSLSTTSPGEIFYVNDSSGLVTAGSGLITDGAGNLTATGSIYASQAVSAGGNVTGGNILTNGYISATGNITTYNTFYGANLSLSGNVISDLNVTGNTTAANVYATNNVSAAGNVNAYTALNSQSLSLSGNVISDLNVTTNIAGNNLSTVNNINTSTLSASGNVMTGNISAQGNITVNSSYYFVGNGSQLTGVTATSVNAANLTGNTLAANVVNSSLTTVGTLANLQVTDYVSAGGNVIGFNIFASSGDVSAAGNITAGSSGNITGANVVTPTLTTSGQLNINAGTGIQISATGNINVGNTFITNLAGPPVNDQDAVNKSYVDSVAQGLSAKASVEVAATTYLANIAGVTNVVYNNGTAGVGATITITTTSQLSIDDINLNTLFTDYGANSRVLIKNEGAYTDSDGAWNGIYNITSTGALSTVLTRSADFNAPAEMYSAFTFVEEGTVNTGSGWVCTNNAESTPITIGTTTITFTQFSGAGTYTAGNALSLTGSQFNVLTDNVTVGINSSNQLSVLGNITLVNPTLGNASFSTLSAIGGQSGNIGAGNISATGTLNIVDVYSTGNLSATGYIYGTTAYVSSVGNTSVVYGNTSNGLASDNYLTYIDSAQQLNTTNLSVTGNIGVSNVSASGNIFDGSLSNTQVVYSGLAGQLLGNAGFTTDGTNISVSGNISTGNISVSGNIIDASINSSSIVYADVNNKLVGNAGLTTDGTNLSVSGNISSGNLSVSGNIYDAGIANSSIVWSYNNQLIGNAGLTTDGTNLSVSGNISALNISLSGNIEAGFAANEVVYSDSNGNLITNTTLGYDGTTLSATSNIYGGNISSYNIYDLNVGANQITYGNSSGNGLISSNVGLTTDGSNLTATGTITGGNITTTGGSGNITGANVISATTFTSTGNVYAVQISTSGNITIANPGGFFIGDGGLLSNVAATSVNANALVGNTLSSNVVNSSLTTVGTLANLSVSGEVDVSGNIIPTTDNTYYIGNAAQAWNTTYTDNISAGTSASVLTVNPTSATQSFAVNGTNANVLWVDGSTNTVEVGNSTVTTGATFAINATDSFLIPVGNTAQRPVTAAVGMQRWNSTLSSLEMWSGSAWETIGATNFTVIQNEQFNGDGTTTTFTLALAQAANQPQTTDSCIVSINGVVQTPTTAYSVSVYTLTFTEAPQIGDTIEVREITTTTTVTALADPTGNTIFSVNLGNAYLSNGNLTLSPGFYFEGDGSQLTNLSANVNATHIVSGSSNVAIAIPSGNVSIQVSGVGNVLNIGTVQATMAGNFIPSSNNAYSLGSATNVWQELYVSNTSIYIGGTALTADANGLAFGGNAVVTANPTGTSSTTGNIQITGDITTNAVYALSWVSTSGNVTAASVVGGIITGSSLSVNGAVSGQTGSLSGNITGGNILTSGLISATANIIGGNILTGGLISATGNIAGNSVSLSGNIRLGGTVSAAGNIAGANLILAAGANITTVAGTNGNVNINPDGTGVFVVTAITPTVFANTTAATSSITGAVTMAGGLGIIGNVISGSNITATGNIVGGNIRTAGGVSATGNITGANLIIASNGNLITTAGSNGNLNVNPDGTGYFTVTDAPVRFGNTTTSISSTTGAFAIAGGFGVAGNINSGGEISATGNITGSYVLGNGALLSGLTPTKIFNGTSEANIGTNNGNANITINGTSNVLVVASTGTYVTGVNSVSGNITSGNVLTGGLISATGTITGSSYLGSVVSVTGTVTAASVVGGVITGSSTSVTGTTTAASVVGGVITGSSTSVTGTTTAASVVGGVITGSSTSVTGNITSGNILTGGLISATGNGTFGNISATSVTGTLATAYQPTITTVGTLGNLSVSGNIIAGNISSTGNLSIGNLNVTGTEADTGNITAGNLLTGGLISATGNGTFGNISATSIAGTLTTSTQTNITQVGTLSSLAVTGNITPGGITMTGNATVGNLYVSGTATIAGNIQQISGNSGQFFGNATTGFNALYAGLPAGFTLLPQSVMNFISNYNGYSQINNQNQNSGAAATTDYVITAGNGTDTTYFLDLGYAGSGYVNTNPSNGLGTALNPNDGYLYVSGNTAGSTYSSFVLGTPDPTSHVRIIVGGSNIANIAMQINSPNTNASSSTTGTVTIGGGLGLTGNIYTSGNITGGNISVTNISGNITTAAQANITAVGTLTSLSVSGNITTGNLSMTGTSRASSYSASGTVTAASVVGGVITGSSTSVTGTTTAASVVGGVMTGSSLSVTGTTTAASVVGGVMTGSSLSVTGTTTAASVVGGVMTGSSLSVSGNVTAASVVGGVITGSSLSVSGNVTGTSHLGTTVSVSGTVTAASVVGGVITGSSLSTSGTVTGSSLVGSISSSQVTTALGYTPYNSTNPNGYQTTSGYVATVSGASQGNITSVGTLSSLSVSGTITASTVNATTLSASGSVYGTVFSGKATTAAYADLAEQYLADALYAPGTVVSFGGDLEVTASTEDSDRRVAGVVSTNPAYLMNSELGGANVVAVALTGRVPCRVTGTVRKGDMMVSNGDGTARSEAYPDVGTVIGKALADFDGDTGVIEIVVGRV